MAVGKIYVITNVLSGKKYVGQTWLSASRRWRGHCSRAKTADFSLSRAIRKYGRESFSVETVYEGSVTQEELDKKEREYIDLYDTFNNGYNQTTGGEGGRHSAEVRKKMSIAHKGVKLSDEHRLSLSRALKGRKHSEETKRKISKANKGRAPWTKGKKRTDDTKRKISIANSGKKRSAEQRRRISESGKGRTPWNKGKKLPKLSPEHRKKISEAISGDKHPLYRVTGEKHPRYGKRHSDEARRKMSEAAKRREAAKRVALDKIG